MRIVKSRARTGKTMQNIFSGQMWGLLSMVFSEERLLQDRRAACVLRSPDFSKHYMYVSGNRRKRCKNKCRTSQPLFPCERSTLFIQNSIIKEECQSVCSAALCKSLQTYHNQSKISNHLGRLHLFFGLRILSSFFCAFHPRFRWYPSIRKPIFQMPTGRFERCSGKCFASG